jgi:hypothetical protein
MAGPKPSRGRVGRTAALVAALCAFASANAAAQDAGADVRMRISTGYEAGPLHRLLLGDGHRELWSAPVRIPVLDLGSYAGGLTPLRPGGGHQTRTLHLLGADGRRYIFRSTDKFVERALPEDLQRTPFQSLVQDQISALHPTGALAVPPLLRAAGVLHVTPRLVVMPDDGRLGEHRAEFAGMIGQIEERPSEGADDAPGFAGSRDVVGMERMLEYMASDPDHRPDERGYLTARLMDFLIGDTDRGTDQWRWARSDLPDGSFLWRPIPRDRDWAFGHSQGLLPRVARRVFPKVVEFDEDYPPLKGLIHSSSHRDRQLLTGLERAAWDSIVGALQAAVTDDVIAAAVAALPDGHAALAGPGMAATLRARRDALPDIAAEFYAWLAEAVEITATTAADSAAIEAFADGSVQVSLFARPSARVAGNGAYVASLRPYYVRRFDPRETDEVRIYLEEGDDAAAVRGPRTSAIAIRVIGGGGRDLLVDASSARVAFYAADDDDTVVAGRRTHVDRRPLRQSVETAGGGWIEQKVTRERQRDYGGGASVRPLVDYESGVGIIAGATLRHTRYGFAHFPYRQRAWISGLAALNGAGFGVEAGITQHAANSRWATSLTARAVQFETLRFYGFGNDSPTADSRDSVLLRLDHARIRPALQFRPTAAVEASAGVRVDHHRPRDAVDTRAGRAGVPGSSTFSAAAAWVEAELDPFGGATRRFAASLRGGAFAAPPVLDAPTAYGGVHAEARAHVSFGPTLALRAGGRQNWGEFPIQEAAFLGGRRSLRGFSQNRFAGDASVYGSAELRVPLGRAYALVRGDAGILAFSDVGRVFVEGDSPGGWHTGVGGGLWFTTLGQTVTAVAAHGEGMRYYLKLGFPF